MRLIIFRHVCEVVQKAILYHQQPLVGENA